MGNGSKVRMVPSHTIGLTDRIPIKVFFDTCNIRAKSEGSSNKCVASRLMLFCNGYRRTSKREQRERKNC